MQICACQPKICNTILATFKPVEAWFFSILQATKEIPVGFIRESFLWGCLANLVEPGEVLLFRIANYWYCSITLLDRPVSSYSCFRRARLYFQAKWAASACFSNVVCWTLLGLSSVLYALSISAGSLARRTFSVLLMVLFRITWAWFPHTT